MYVCVCTVVVVVVVVVGYTLSQTGDKHWTDLPHCALMHYGPKTDFTCGTMTL